MARKSEGEAMHPAALAIELTLVFLTPPLVIASGLLPRVMVMPALWLVFLYAGWIMVRNRMTLFAGGGGAVVLVPMLLRAAMVIAGMALFTAVFYPDRLFALVIEKPDLWVMVMVFYPLLSVLPQEIAFRRFFFERYRPLFGEGEVMLVINAAVFAYVHIVFLNPVALLFTFVGGLLFAYTYNRSRSVLLVSLEHALYGNAIYTLGLGHFFYHNGVH
jgi:uncharacterized protein